MATLCAKAECYLLFSAVFSVESFVLRGAPASSANTGFRPLKLFGCTSDLLEFGNFTPGRLRKAAEPIGRGIDEGRCACQNLRYQQPCTRSDAKAMA